jgi:hypothetical protein
MADPTPIHPRLVSAKDAASEGAEPAQTESAAPARRSPVFWLLVLLAATASIAFAIQTERVRVLQASNAGLQGEIFSTRTALAAYTDRFAVVRDTVAGLQAQLDALNSLVSDDPTAADSATAEPTMSPRPATPLD